MPANAFENSTISYDVEAETPSAAVISWDPQLLTFAKRQIDNEKAKVKSYVRDAKANGTASLQIDAIKELRQKYSVLLMDNKPCNFAFNFFDFASWARPTCEFKYVDAKAYLVAAMKAFLRANPGYNPTEDRDSVVNYLDEISNHHWDYKIRNGWFSCPKQIEMGTSAGFPMESKSSPTVRALRVTISPANKWHFSVTVLARNFQTLAANAKISPKTSPFGIDFNFH